MKLPLIGESPALPLASMPSRATLLAAMGIRPEETRRTLQLFAYLFLASLVFTTGRTARDALFLSHYPITWLPWMFVGYGAVAAAITPFYARLTDRFRRDRFNAVFATALAISYLGAWVLARTGWEPLYAILYVWVEITNNLLIVQFWTLTNELHDPRSGKRLFGVIGSSRLIGIVVCGLSVGALVSFIGTQALLLVNAAVLAVMVLLIRAIGSAHFSPAALATRAAPHAHGSKPEAAPPIELRHSPYLLTIVVMILATFLAATIGDYQFKAIAKSTYTGDKLAAFFAVFYAATGLAAFFLHFFGTARILASLGILAGLLAMPLAFGMSSLAILLTGGALSAAVALKFSDLAFQYTLTDSSLQMLYYPLPASTKGRLRAVLEGSIKPIGYALGGLILVVLAARVEPTTLSWVVLPVAAVWIASVVRVRGLYASSLVEALRMRRLEGQSLEITATPETIAALREAAQSPSEFAAEFALNELASLDRTQADAMVQTMLASNTHRDLAMRYITRWGGEATSLIRYLDDPEPRVRAAAIEAYAAAAHEDAIELLLARMASASQDDADRMCAALLRHGGLDGLLAAGARLRSLLDGDTHARVRAARILEWAALRDLYRPVRQLLAHPDAQVQRAAVLAAGQSRNPKLVESLLTSAERNHLRTPSLSAIERIGAEAMPVLERALEPGHKADSIRVRLPRVIRRIGGPQAPVVLWRHALDANDTVRGSILHHGARLHEEQHYAVDSAIRTQVLQLEAARAALWMSLRIRMDAQSPALVTEALDRAIYWCRRRVLSLLRLELGAETTTRIRSNLESKDTTRRALALETLDTLAPASMHSWLVAFFDDSDRAKALAALRSAFRLAPEPHKNGDPYLTLLDQGHDFIQAAVVRYLHACERSDEILAHLPAQPGPWLLQELQRLPRSAATSIPAPTDMESSMTTLEKLLLLKQVSLFERAPSEDLAELANEAGVVRFDPGTTIFREGDPGDALYVVVEGRVRIHTGEHKLAEMGKGECFGEMAILDDAPRSASVTALDAVTTLKITQEDFFEFLADWPDVARDVFIVLIQRLRKADAEIRRLSQPVAHQP